MWRLRWRQKEGNHTCKPLLSRQNFSVRETKWICLVSWIPGQTETMHKTSCHRRSVEEAYIEKASSWEFELLDGHGAERMSKHNSPGLFHIYSSTYFPISLYLIMSGRPQSKPNGNVRRDCIIASITNVVPLTIPPNRYHLQSLGASSSPEMQPSHIPKSPRL